MSPGCEGAMADAPPPEARALIRRRTGDGELPRMLEESSDELLAAHVG